MQDILINIFCGFVGGLLVYYFQTKKEEKTKKNQLIDNFKSQRKELPNDFIYSMLPGISMNKVEQLIGIPDYSFKINEIELFGEGKILDINEYFFANCKIKIIHSENNIDAIFVYGYFDQNVEFIKYDSPFDKNILCKFAVDHSFEDNVEIIYELSSRECWFGIVEYHGRMGNYNHFCYYGSLEPEYANDSIKLENLIGRLIEDVSVSNDQKLFKYH